MFASEKMFKQSGLSVPKEAPDDDEDDDVEGDSKPGCDALFFLKSVIINCNFVLLCIV